MIPRLSRAEFNVLSGSAPESRGRQASSHQTSPPHVYTRTRVHGRAHVSARSHTAARSVVAYAARKYTRCPVATSTYFKEENAESQYRKNAGYFDISNNDVLYLSCKLYENKNEEFCRIKLCRAKWKKKSRLFSLLFFREVQIRDSLVQLLRARNCEDAKKYRIVLNNRRRRESKFFFFISIREKVPDFWSTLYTRTRRSALVGSPQFALRELAVGTVTSATKPFGSLSLLCFPSTRCSSRILTAKEVTDGHAIIRNSFSEDDYDNLAKLVFFLPLRWQIEIKKNLRKYFSNPFHALAK